MEGREHDGSRFLFVFCFLFWSFYGFLSLTFSSTNNKSDGFISLLSLGPQQLLIKKWLGGWLGGWGLGFNGGGEFGDCCT